MLRLRKHITFLLSGIFIYPIIFQPVHIIRHHSHGYKGEYHLCHMETDDNDDLSITINISREEKICPICEYQFSVNDLPRFQVFRSIIPVVACSFDQIASQLQYRKIFKDISPRAPPILIS